MNEHLTDTHMTTDLNQEIIDSLTWRRAVKVYDPSKKVSDADLATILEAGRLAPSSLGMEPWKFIVVKDPAIRAKLREAAYGQAQVTDASHLIVITRTTDTDRIASDLIARAAEAQNKQPDALKGYFDMVTGAIAKKTEGAVRDGWLAAQSYIPFGIMMETASLLGIDNTGMEGFDNAKVDEILGLAPMHLASVTFLVLGYRGDDAYSKRPKVRMSMRDATITL